MGEIQHILAIDQGTSGTKAIIFDGQGQLCAKATAPLTSYHPQVGFVEQDPLEIYGNVLTAVAECLETFRETHFDIPLNLIPTGISNQRETFVVWDEEGNPLHNAVVWQCKRSLDICDDLAAKGLEPEIQKRTGLTIDPYFSATKLMWLNENIPAVQTAIQQGKAHFGTVDSWLVFKLTNGGVFATDHTNASRTLFYNIFELQWDAFLLEKFGLTGLKLPDVKPSASQYGQTHFEGLLSEPIPITAAIGDSHAAFFGENCFQEGMAKATLGTGCSILWNLGDQADLMDNGMLTTIGWSIPNKIAYAAEGVIVSCGSTIEWLRKQLSLFSEVSEIEPMAVSLKDNEGVYLVPAFSGMGAPHWKKDWKASIHGLTFGSTPAHLIRAGLESIAYQIKDIISSIENTTPHRLKELKVDGGITANQFLVQFCTDLLGKTITNVGIADVSALGAALMAGMGAGLWNTLGDLPQLPKDSIKKYGPNLERTTEVQAYHQLWKALLAHKRN